MSASRARTYRPGSAPTNSMLTILGRHAALRRPADSRPTAGRTVTGKGRSTLSGDVCRRAASARRDSRRGGSPCSGPLDAGPAAVPYTAQTAQISSAYGRNRSMTIASGPTACPALITESAGCRDPPSAARARAPARALSSGPPLPSHRPCSLRSGSVRVPRRSLCAPSAFSWHLAGPSLRRCTPGDGRCQPIGGHGCSPSCRPAPPLGQLAAVVVCAEWRGVIHGVGAHHG